MAENKIVVRRAEKEDVNSRADVLLAAFLEYKLQYTLAGFEATTPKADVIATRFEEGPMWVALLDGELVGTVGSALREKEVYVRSMAVVSSARGHGIGKRLLTEVEQFAGGKGYKRLILSTTPFLEAAIGLYAEMGFVRADEGPDNLYGTALFTMVKDLNV